jgi:hypothetical protein
MGAGWRGVSQKAAFAVFVAVLGMTLEDDFVTFCVNSSIALAKTLVAGHV